MIDLGWETGWEQQVMLAKQKHSHPQEALGKVPAYRGVKFSLEVAEQMTREYLNNNYHPL